jgi:uncharacterized membrane protein YqjE
MAISTEEMRARERAETSGEIRIGQAIQEVSERAQILVREEIELAKAEVTEKVSVLIRGAVVGIVAGIFAVIGLLFLLHGLAWLVWFVLFSGSSNYFWGFFIVAGVLFLLGALAGFLATRAFKKGSPPTPQLAIDEAKRIRETVQSEHPEQTI